jgi:hypothetical protein
VRADRSVRVAGAVTLGNGVATLNVSYFGGFTPAIGQSFDILTTTGGVTGNFAGLPEGAAFFVGGVGLLITHKGAASHHDVVLSVASDTAAVIGATWWCSVTTPRRPPWSVTRAASSPSRSPAGRPGRVDGQ